MLVAAFNATDGPLVVDDLGHTLEGGAFGVADTTTDQVKQAAEAGELHLFTGGIDSGSGQNPDAVAASKQAKALNDRKALLESYDKDILAAAADEADDVTTTADATKAELVAALLYSSYDPTDTETTTTVEPAEEPKPKPKAKAGSS